MGRNEGHVQRLYPLEGKDSLNAHTDDETARSGVPVRREETGERGDKVYTSAVGHG